MNKLPDCGCGRRNEYAIIENGTTHFPCKATWEELHDQVVKLREDTGRMSVLLLKIARSPSEGNGLLRVDPSLIVAALDEFKLYE